MSTESYITTKSIGWNVPNKVIIREADTADKITIVDANILDKI